MLTQSKIKLIKSLDQKKYRNKHRCFIVEGEKMIDELFRAKNYTILEVFTTDSELIAKNKKLPIYLITEKELLRISHLKSPNKTIALVKIPETNIKVSVNQNELSIALDNIQDPGNLGTIIRTASWFGVNTIYCSEFSADIYNPKVIQSTMGAIFNLNIIYTDLNKLIASVNTQNYPIYGTMLDGENLYQKKLSKKGLLIMGNESKGISPEIEKTLTQKILIPNYPEDNKRMESLNVGIAFAITLAEFRRQA